jgi:hypothetical protein
LTEGVLLVATFIPLGYLRRETLFFNRANRRLYGGLIATAVAVELFWLSAFVSDLPVDHALALTPLLYTYCFSALAITLDKRLWWGTGCLALAGVLTGLFPMWAYELIGVGGFAAVVATSRAWAAAK